MKILFVLENITDICGANVNIAIVLAKQLTNYFEIHALARYDEVKPISYKNKKIFQKIHTFYANQPGNLVKFTANDYKNMGMFKKFVRFLKSPLMLISMIDAKFFNFSITKRKCTKAIVKICNQEKYDVVIGVSAPYYIMQAVAKANISCRKMAIQLDTFTNNFTLPFFLKKTRRRIEKKVISRIDTLFAADFFYNEIENITKQKYKCIPFPLPGIIVEKLKKQEKIKVNIDNSGFVHFLFVGQFYEQIRNPKYLLNLFTKLPKNYILHIVGGGCDQTLMIYKELLLDRLILHGWVSKDEADQFISKYDIMVNVNNSITNQLPSKLFEYIGTGKPILNICKSAYCLSIPYIKKYDNGINISETNEVMSNDINKIINFIDANKTCIIDENRILETFESNTDVHVAKLIVNKIISEEQIQNDK